MIRVILATVAVAALALPAAAGNICRPDRNEPLRLTGVSSGDRVAVREGPGSDFRRVGDLVAGQRDIRATGRARATTQRCADACADLIDGFGGGGLAGAIDRDCRQEGRLWYEVRTSRGLQGWVSARRLAMAGGVVPPRPPRPPRPPGEPGDGLLRFLCRDGDRLTLDIAAGRERAILTDGAGRVWPLDRRAENNVYIDFFTTTAEGPAQLTGTGKSVMWARPGRRPVRCDAWR